MGVSRRGFLATPLALAAAQALRAAERRPNVILMVAGTWRAQAVPWAGDTDIVAPNLARFAAQAMTFSRAYASYARSDRSRVCLLKGIFSHTLAMPDSFVDGPLAEVEHTKHHGSQKIEFLLMPEEENAKPFTVREKSRFLVP